MTEPADQLHHNNVTANSTALVQALFGKASHHPGLSAPQQPRFDSLRYLAFPKAKIAFERGEICECDVHTVHRLSQRRLAADWLAPREGDCSRMHSKVSSDWLPSYIKATRPVFEIFKMAGYFPDRPRKYSIECYMFRPYVRLSDNKMHSLKQKCVAYVWTFLCTLAYVLSNNVFYCVMVVLSPVRLALGEEFDKLCCVGRQSTQ